MTNLAYNLYCKQRLKFREDGTFKVLMMSDIQETLAYDERTLRGMERLVEKMQPDLVMLGGDICNGLVLKTAEELKRYLDIFSAPMERRGIPWAHVYGNHDHDMDVTDAEKSVIYEGYAHCVSKHTEGIGGKSNFVLPVRSAAEDQIAFCIWGMDTNNEVRHTDIPHEKDYMDFVRPVVSTCWDTLHFDQLMWYWNSSVELERHCGKKVHGMMFMHIAPWEFQYIVENMVRTGGRGSTVESMGLSMFNSGLFSTILQRGDIHCIACGHSHEDSFDGTFCGVKMCLDACAGYSPYGIDELRGGRVFEIREDAPCDVKTYMVHYKNL